MSEENKEATAAPAEAAAAEPKEAPPAPFYDNKIKDGSVYLKRRKGSPRLRKVAAKNHKAELFYLVKGEWKHMPNLLKDGKSAKTISWHVHNKWQRISSDEAQKFIKGA